MRNGLKVICGGLLPLVAIVIAVSSQTCSPGKKSAAPVTCEFMIAYSPDYGPMTAVWGASVSDVFVGGSGGRIARFDGNSWNIETELDFDVDVETIWGSSAEDVYVGGRKQCPSGWEVMMVHFDGDEWSDVELPVEDWVIDIWGFGPDSVYAIVWEPYSGLMGTNLLVFDGSEWSVMEHFPDETMDAIWGSSPESLYLASERRLLKYNGVGWLEWTTNSLDWHFPGPRAMWGSGEDDVFVAGGEGRVFHFDGDSWLETPTPIEEDLFTLWGNGPSDVYAGGRYGAVIHYDGSSWVELETPITDIIFGLWGEPDQGVFAVWGGGVARHDGEQWWNDTSLLTPEVFDVWSADGESALASGNNGMVIDDVTGLWEITNTGAGGELLSIGGASRNDFWVGGFSGKLLHYSGSSWSHASSSAIDNDLTISSLRGLGDGSTVATGTVTVSIWAGDEYIGSSTRGELLVHESGQWHKAHSELQMVIRECWGETSADMWCVGNGFSYYDETDGFIARYHDGEFEAVVTGGEPMNSIVGTSSSNIVAVGNSGRVERFNGSAWTSEDSGTDADLEGIIASGSTNYFVAGGAGVLIQRVGGSWEPVPFTMFGDPDATAEDWWFWSLSGDPVTGVYAIATGVATDHERAVLKSSCEPSP